MQHAVVGHSAVRRRLWEQTGPFILIGPAGVGRRGIVTEWLGDRPHDTLQPTKLAEAQRGSRWWTLDATTVRSWTPFLKPLEDGTLRVVVLAEADPPAPVLSRLPLYRCGYLTTAEVTTVLAERHPRVTPRPIIAELAQGSLADLRLLVAAAEEHPNLDRQIAERRTAPALRRDPVIVAMAWQLICRAVLGLSQAPISPQTRAAISPRLATEVAAWEPGPKHRTRNRLAMWFSELDRG